MNFDALRLFAIASKQTRKVATPESRRLSLEVLEDRALLSATDIPVFCGPPTYEAWLAQQETLERTRVDLSKDVFVSSSANIFTETPLYVASIAENSRTNFAPLQDVYQQYLDEDFVDEDDELEESIEVVSVTFLDNDSDSDDSESDESENDEGGTRSFDWPISLQCVLHSASNTSVPGVQNVLRESYGVSGTPFDPVSFSGDYISIELPVLPLNYQGVITIANLSPSSSISYLVSGVTPAIPGAMIGTFFFGGGSSGGAQVLYLVPINDAVPSSDKFLEITLGSPICIAPSGGIDYTFTLFNQTVSAMIVDDDHWNVALAPDYEVVYDEDGHVIPQTLTEGSEIANGTYVTFTLSRGGDGTVRSSDRSYPIKVKLSLNGQTDYDDYILSYSCNEGTTWSNATPSAGSVEISIPTNTDSIKFRVHANDDLTVERSFETLNISINEAKNGFAEYSYIEYPFVFVERKLQVQDVGTLTLEDVQFINNEALKSDNAAASESWQNELHWKKDHLEQTRPIAYVSDKKLKTTAHFSGNIDSSITSLKIRYRVIGIGSGGCRPHKLLTFQTAQIVSL